jgi:hypothetical protein
VLHAATLPLLTARTIRTMATEYLIHLAAATLIHQTECYLQETSR